MCKKIGSLSMFGGTSCSREHVRDKKKYVNNDQAFFENAKWVEN